MKDSPDSTPDEETHVDTILGLVDFVKKLEKIRRDATGDSNKYYQ
jgi:hypothetical protein